MDQTYLYLSVVDHLSPKSETTLILRAIISMITGFATSSIWRSEPSDDHMHWSKETFAKRCIVTYKYKSSDWLYLILEFTGIFV